MANYAVQYHEENIAEYKKQQEEAFHKISDLAQKYGMPFSVVMDELIPLWVDGTYAANWRGWHEYGKHEAETENEAVNA